MNIEQIDVVLCEDGKTVLCIGFTDDDDVTFTCSFEAEQIGGDPFSTLDDEDEYRAMAACVFGLRHKLGVV